MVGPGQRQRGGWRVEGEGAGTCRMRKEEEEEGRFSHLLACVYCVCVCDHVV